MPPEKGGILIVEKPLKSKISIGDAQNRQKGKPSPVGN